MSNRINLEETQKGIYFQIDRARSKTNGDTFDANMLLQQNGTSNGNTKIWRWTPTYRKKVRTS